MNSFLTLLSYFPLALLQRIAGVLSAVIFHIIRYRRSVASDNLQHSFPDASKTQIDSLCRQAYRNLAEVVLESIKLNTLSDQAIKRRMKFTNTEVLQWDQRSVILVGAHYANWEWLARRIYIESPNPVHGIYKPLHNPSADRFIKKVRGTEMHLFPKEDMVRTALQLRGKPFTICLLSDQSPSNLKSSVWIDFLGRDTAFSTGLARLSTVLNAPVFYMDNQRLSQGMYQVQFTALGLAQKGAELEFMRAYAKQLEQSIRTRPEPWIWTHRRWKHTREE